MTRIIAYNILEGNGYNEKDVELLAEEFTMLVREHKKMKIALEFYADKKNWETPSTGFAVQYDPEPSPVKKDNGFMASMVLESL